VVGIPDCAVPNVSLGETYDTDINGADDRADMRRLVLQRLPILPPDTRAVLRFQSESDAEAVRIFDEEDEFVLGPGPDGNETLHVVANIEQEGSAEELTYFMEGIIPGEELLLELALQRQDGGDGSDSWSDVPKCRDTITVTVAPFLLAPNDRPAQMAVVPPLQDFLDNGTRSTAGPIPPKSGTTTPTELAAPITAIADRVDGEIRQGPTISFFWQDPLQFGYAAAPDADAEEGQRILPMVAKLVFKPASTEDPAEEPPILAKGRANWATYPYGPSNAQGQNARLIGPGLGVFEPIPAEPLRRNESRPEVFGGNHEVSWPGAADETHPGYGRLTMGAENTDYLDYYRQHQDIQTEVVTPALDWLSVKHWDEIAYTLDNDKVLVPDPRLGRQLLADHLAADADRAKEPVFYEGAVQGFGSIAAVREDPDRVRVAKGIFIDVLALEFDPEVLRVTSDMRQSFLHVYDGQARYQTFFIAAVDATENELFVPAFDTGHFWRTVASAPPAVGDQIYVVEAPLGEAPPREIEAFAEREGDESRMIDWFNPITLSLGELFDIDAEESDAVGHLWEVNASAAERLDANIAALQELQPATVIRVPVLFWNERKAGLEIDESGGKEPIRDGTAFTVNLVNGHLFDDTFIAPQSFVLSLDREGGARDLFAEATRSRLQEAAPGIAYAEANDWYFFHLRDGEVHCTAAILRLPDPAIDPPWWDDREEE